MTTDDANDLTDAEQAAIDRLLFESADEGENELLNPDPDAPDYDPDYDLALDEEFDLTEIKAFDEATGRTLEAPTKKLTEAGAKFFSTQRLLTVMQVRALKPPNWFLHELIPEAPLTVLHGTGGTKKSFFMLDLALHADAGIPWHGRPIRPGRTLYVLGEGISGTGKRITAWCNFHDVDPATLKTQFVSHPLDLFGWSRTNEKGEFSTQVEAWRAAVEHMGFDYVVIDTLHRNAPGADENKAQDIGSVFSAAQRIAGSAHLFFVHHDPKEGKTARGSSSIHDDADVVLRIQQKDDNTSTLHSEKLRDADDFKPVDLHFLKDKVVDSLVIDTIEQWKPKKSKRQEILDTVRAEPNRLTKTDILCIVGKSNDAVFKKLVDESVLVSEVRASTKPRGPRMVDVWHVDESNADPNDEEYDLSGD